MFGAEEIQTHLRARPASAAELAQTLGSSQPTISRALQLLQRQGRVLKMGTTRAARYGLLRPVGAAGSSWPVFQVDGMGAIRQLGTLHALESHHYYCDVGVAPLRSGISDELPYFLQDQRPAGFLGRAVPTQCPELALPARVIDWTDDHYLTWLTRRGADCVGDLVVGAEAFERHLQALKSRQGIAAADRAAAYPQLAADAMARGQPGSSAHGEHPKFTALIDHLDRRVQVIVKFSPPIDSPVGQRWADLLIAEHLAHVHLDAHGIAAAHSTLLRSGARMFLEVERFDRVGAEGRVGVVSMLAVDTARFGMLDTWSRAAARLAQQGALPSADARQISLIEAFAMLTANTDRHFGNFTLFDRYDGRFRSAPVYDMLPMLFAPQNEQLVERVFEPPDPTAETLQFWPRARALAEGYWQRLIADERVSPEFRAISREALSALKATPNRAAV